MRGSGASEAAGFSVVELKIPEIFGDDEEAVRLLCECFARRRSGGGPFYSGAYFERLGGGGDAECRADRFDGDDLVAVTVLSVSLTPHGAINLLTDPEGHGARLLSLIPRDARLEHPGSDAFIEDGGPAWELWHGWPTAPTPGQPDGSGPVVAGKLPARKRPHRVPVYDIRVTSASNSSSSDRRRTTPSGPRRLRHSRGQRRLPRPAGSSP
ncbi:DUF6308 family protein [Streptomyces sp. NPDC048577]|uniref:DUF6308 family protein n=1 Tax=Streptomyces sp. NPDC048577 TaxID=3157209 RepID=UPI0034241CAE